MTNAQVENGLYSSNPLEPTDPWANVMVKASVEIKFKKAGEIDFETTEQKSELKEDDFLNREFKDVKRLNWT